MSSPPPPADQFCYHYVQNVVTTYWTGINSTYLNHKERINPDINLAAIALSTSAKYNPSVFPAVMCKNRIRNHGVPIPPIDHDAVYPLKAIRRETAQKSTAGDSESVDASQPKKKKRKVNAPAWAKHALADIPDENPGAFPLQPYIYITDSQFQSGKNVVAGKPQCADRSLCLMPNLMMAYKHTQRLSQELKLDLRPYNAAAQNIVCSGVLGFQLNLDYMKSVGDDREWDVHYVPEEFRGLTHFTAEAVYVLFDTGKFVATGIKTVAAIEKSEAKLRSYISEFRVGNEPSTWLANAPPSCMRDEETLNNIARFIDKSASSSSSTGRSRSNAAVKQSKTVIAKVKRLMMVLTEIEEEDADADDEHSDGEQAVDALTSEERVEALGGLLDFRV